MVVVIWNRRLIWNLIWIGMVGGMTYGFSQQYRSMFEADRGLLEELESNRLTNWLQEQLTIMQQRYPNLKDEMEFLSARYEQVRTKRQKMLEAIPKTNKFYFQARYLLAKEITDRSQQRNLLEAILNEINTANKREEEKDILSKVENLLLNIYIDLGDTKKALELLQKSNQDERYLTYMKAYLNYLVADRELKEKGRLSPETVKSVKETTTMVEKSPLLWRIDYIGALAYCEVAHGYILLEDVDKAYQYLRSVFPMLNQIDESLTGDQKAFSPKIPALYWLARCYELQYQLMKKTGKVPVVEMLEKNELVKKQLPEKDAIRYFLGKAYNIYQFDLQIPEYRNNRYAQMALTDAMRVAELLKREGIPVPNPDREVLRTVAFREATELFQQNKFEEAAKKFEEAVSDKSGKTGDERDLEALYYATIAWCRANQFQRAADVAKRVVQIFPREMRAWDTVYNTGALALRFYTENRAQQPEQAEKAMTIGNELFLFLVEKNPTYPKAVNAVWQIAEGHWRDASNLSQEKKKLAQQLEQAQKDQQEKILNQIKKIDDEITLKYQEAIKIYELILKNYATSSYANVALYRLGWIQHLFRNREKAIEYFQQFVQKEGKVNSDVLDAMYLIGDSWFRLKRHDEAINQLQKVKDVLEKNQYVLPEDEKAAANAKSKIDRITKSTYTLLAWCYQDKGDSLLEQAESYRDQLNEIQDLIAQYRTSIEGAKDDNELLSLPPIPTGTPPVVSDRVEEGKLPDDFIFRSFLERAGLSVDLTMELPLMSEIHIRQGKVIIGWGPDVITSEDGTGFTVTVKGDRLLWDSVPVACYRRGKLLGIFDTVSRSFNSPKPEQQVPTAIEWPESFPPKIPVFAARIYLALLNARFRRVQQEVEKVRMEGMKWQQQALDQLIGFVKNPQYASDPHYAPRCLLLISSNYINRGEWEKASEYLNTLQKKFPQSEESQRAPIQLFRVLLEASKKAADPQKEKELREQAMKQTAFLKSDVGKLSMNNLRYLAFGLFSLNENQEYTNPAPDVSMAALDELLRRMGSEKTEENREDLNRLKEKVLYYKIVALTLLKRETEALSFIDKILAENQKSAYLFRLYQLKAGIYLEQKKYDDALIAVANITTKADRNNYKAEFWQGILLAGRIYLAKNTKPDVQKALLSFQNVVEYVDPKDEELQSIRESAYYYLAKCFALLGQREKAVEIQTRYLKEYPNGKWRKAIGNLPPSAF